MTLTSVPAGSKTFWLSTHVGYACRDEGACCTAGWPIPIERPQADAVQAALADGRLPATVHWLGVAALQPEDVAGVLAVDGAGCVFHHGHRCAIQTVLGHDALPSCCQHFPRDVMIDDRGVFVTLSHYCPTAAALLFAHDGPIRIVAGPPAARVPQGLDARGVLPPLLCADVLMDLPALTEWEAHVVSWLGGWRNPHGRWSPEQALACLESDAKALAAWRPGSHSLSDAMAALRSAPPPSIDAPNWEDERQLREAARAAVVPPYTWAADPPLLEQQWEGLRVRWHANAAVINRFLAAHAFASWLPYQGGDVAAGIRRLRLALAVLRAETVRRLDAARPALTADVLKEAIRQTDLLLVHLIDRQRLAATLTAKSR